MLRWTIAVSALLMAQPSSHAQEVSRLAIPQVLSRPLRGGLTLENYLAQVMSPFRSLLRDRAGIDAAGLKAERDAITLRAEQEGVSRIIVFDLNGDGKVTEEEIRTGISAQLPKGSRDGASYLAMVERQVRDVMSADTNKDGVIDISEMRAAGVRARSRSYSNGTSPEDYLQLVPEGASLTPAILFERARATFEMIDVNKDTLLTRDEVNAALAAATPSAQEQPASTAVMPMLAQGARPSPLAQAMPMTSTTTYCDVPRPASEDRILAYGTYEGGAYSTAALGGPDAETRTGVVTVEQGTDPLYVVLSTFMPMIWRFEGDVGRVHRVLLTSGQGKAPMTGVIGLPRDKVTFTPPANCLKLWYKGESVEGAETKGVLTTLLGRKPDGMEGDYTALRVSLPSLASEDAKGRARPEPLPGMSGYIAALAFQSAPNGLVDVDPKAVVTDGPVMTYDILPSLFGISQLVRDGALIDLGRSQYKIAKTFAHFPARMTGGGILKFLLGSGVQLPGGDVGWACIVSEDTGRPVKPSLLCR